MLTEKDYCDYETSIALEELGFPIDWFEDETYHENNTEISLYEAQKWLREERGIYINVKIFPLKCQWEISFERENGNIITSYGDFYDTANWYIMFNDCIKEAVKILKEE